MEFTIRKLKTDDLFPVMTILSKIGIKEIQNNISPDAIRQMMNAVTDSGVEGDATRFVGLSLILGIVQTLTEKLPLCQKELYKFISSVSGLTVDEIAELSPANFVELLETIVSCDDFADFFRVVVNWVKKIR